MATPKVLALRAAGTNCEQETMHAFTLAGAKAEAKHINQLLKEKNCLADYQIIVFSGGFTYGDDIASAKILAVEVEHCLGQELQTFIDKGNLVIGICNGFQLLIKTGLLPYAKFTPGQQRKFTLTHNQQHRFECRWIKLKAPKNSHCIFVEPGEEIDMPVAHGEGRLICNNPAALKELHTNGQIAYQYITKDSSPNPVYPENPNGSTDHIAGICDKSGRVFGLMPHPERHTYKYQHPTWTRQKLQDPTAEGAGLKIFKRAVAFFA